MSWHACGGQRTMFRGQLSRTMWVAGSELRSSDLMASTFTHLTLSLKYFFLVSTSFSLCPFLNFPSSRVKFLVWISKGHMTRGGMMICRAQVTCFFIISKEERIILFLNLTEEHWDLVSCPSWESSFVLLRPASFVNCRVGWAILQGPLKKMTVSHFPGRELGFGSTTRRLVEAFLPGYQTSGAGRCEALDTAPFWGVEGWAQWSRGRSDLRASVLQSA